MSLIEKTNYRSGISVALGGTNGTAYMVERFYHDPLLSRDVVYLRDDTTITLSTNALNTAGRTGLQSTPVGAAGGGLIRYRVDGDMHWGPMWVGNGKYGTNLNPAYSTPLTFAALQYPTAQGSLSVLGRTGDNGVTLDETPASRLSYFHYGHLDTVGDEVHVIHVGHDDSAFLTNDTNFQASDGRSHIFIVEPRTAAIQLRATGNAQFYTTPLKKYFIPRIHSQTSYILPRTGTIEIELKDLFGADVNYRINGGSWTTHANPVLTDSAFSDGSNTLEWYVTGNEPYVKTRTVVKNPTWPSASETHGLILFGTTGNRAAALARTTQGPYAYFWNRVKTRYDKGEREQWRSRVAGGRYVPRGALLNAMCAQFYGLSAGVANQSYASWAKEMILENGRILDNVGFELFHTQNHRPTMELTYRGYWDCYSSMHTALAYDILISIYRSDMHADGITPIEDYHIRDCIADDIFEAQWYSGNFTSDGRI